jgi:hypothetical protein
MRYTIRLVWLAAALAVCCSCAGRKSTQELSASGQEQNGTLATFWAGHDFTSLDGFSDIKAAEDKFDEYIKLLSAVEHGSAVKHMNHFLDSAAQNVVAYMVWAGWFEPFLHAKESPYRNDSLFVAYLDKALKDNVIDDAYMVEHLQMLRQYMSVNKVGMAPQELLLKNEAGLEFNLSELKGESVLLLFVDADCPSCLAALADNVKEYKDRKLVAVLVNGSQYHLSNIRAQLAEDVLAPWTFAYCPQGRLEEEALYDTSLLPFRMEVNSSWIIEKSYF